MTALSTLRTLPGLVLLTAALGAAQAAAQARQFGHNGIWVSLVVLGVVAFEFGFGGTQRVWLMHGLRSRRFPAGQAWTLTWRYFGRFFRLGLFVAWPVVVVLIVALVFAIVLNSQWIIVVVGVAVGWALDALLTFVVPELTFGADSVGRAWSIGNAMRRTSWPQCRWYVLTPGLAVLAVGNASGRLDHNAWQAAVAGGVAALVALSMKGTILSYYLRLQPSSAYFLDRPEFNKLPDLRTAKLPTKD